MKITLLLLLLILNAIFPDVMLLFPIFVAYCFPNHFNSGYKKLLNFLANTLIVYLLVLLPFFIAGTASYFQELVKIMKWLRKIYLFDLFFFSTFPIGILLIFKFQYKIKDFNKRCNNKYYWRFNSRFPIRSSRKIAFKL